MKSKEEINQLAKEFYPLLTTDLICSPKLVRDGYFKGYTQCQKDMADYIFEVAKEFHRLGKYSGQTSDTHFVDVYEETIKSLNKQE